MQCMSVDSHFSFRRLTPSKPYIVSLPPPSTSCLIIRFDESCRGDSNHSYTNRGYEGVHVYACAEGKVSRYNGLDRGKGDISTDCTINYLINWFRCFFALQQPEVLPSPSSVTILAAPPLRSAEVYCAPLSHKHVSILTTHFEYWCLSRYTKWRGL